MSSIPFFHNSLAAETSEIETEIKNISKKIDELSLRKIDNLLEKKFMSGELKATPVIGKSKPASSINGECPLNSHYPEILFLSPLIEAFKNYIESRQNGKNEDSPKEAFPSGGLEKFNSFGYTIDHNKKDGYHQFTVTALHCPQNEKNFVLRVTPSPNDNTLICQLTISDRKDGRILHEITLNGFSWVSDIEKGLPDAHGKYWSYIQYTDEKDKPIQEWMEKRDQNYQQRCEIFHKNDEKLTDQIKDLKQKREALLISLKQESETNKNSIRPCSPSI